MERRIRSDAQTTNRVYGSVCPKHPEMKGLRYKPRVTKKLTTDCDLVTYIKQGSCVGCNRERTQRRVEGLSLHFGIDDKFGAVWRDLSDAVKQWGMNEATQAL